MDSSKGVALKRSFGIPPLRNSIITGKTKREILIGINDRARSEIRAKELSCKRLREQQLFDELRNKVFFQAKESNESVKTRHFATVEVLVPNRAPPNIYARYKRKREGRISIIERGREEAKVERGDGSKAILEQSMRPSPFLLSLLHFPSSFPQRVIKAIKSIKICRDEPRGCNSRERKSCGKAREIIEIFQVFGRDKAR